MSALADADHAWFRRHLPDHLLDLLEGDERRRFDAHARACPACAKLLASALGARADWWDGAGHPPIAALAAWNPEARGERAADLVRAHLAHCEACRQDLADLRGPALAAALASAPRGRARPRFAPRIAWAPALAAAATVLAMVVVVRVATPPTDRLAVPAPVPPAADAPAEHGTGSAAPPPPPVSGPEPEPIEIRAAERGEAAAPTIVPIAPGARRVRLTLPALFVPAGATLALELRGPGGAVAWRQALIAERALRRGGVELPAAALAGGPYVLHVTWTDPDSGESARTYALDVRTSP